MPNLHTNHFAAYTLMNSFSRYLSRGLFALSLLTACLAVAVHYGCHAPLALALAKVLLTGGFACATAYPVVNATTYSDALSDTAKAAEEIWVRRALFGADHSQMYNINPFTDNMVGGPGSGKAIINVPDTTKVSGTTVNIPLRAGFGGPGVAAGGMRSGSEQKIRFGNMQVKIGKFWFGGAYQQTAKDQTVTGDDFDQSINDGMRELHATKRSRDHFKRLIAVLGTTKGAQNLLFADGVQNIAALKSANVVTSALLTKLNSELPSRGAKPMNTVKDWKKESAVEQFMIMGSNLALGPLKSDALYADAVTHAAPRSNDNPRFTGAFADYDGIGIYRWNLMDHGNEGSIGSPLTPRARLGAAVAGAGANTVLTGGGFMYNAANPLMPFYYEDFPGAPYLYYNGDTINAETASTKYVLIYDPTTGLNGVFPYQVTDGHTLTLSGGALAVGATGLRTTNFAQGSLVVPCNVLGTPWGYVLAYGAEMLTSGVGSINGSPTPQGAQMGRKTMEIRNHGEDIAIGLEGVWGNAAVNRLDGCYPNFLLSAVALPVPGAPTIS